MFRINNRPSRHGTTEHPGRIRGVGNADRARINEERRLARIAEEDRQAAAAAAALRKSLRVHLRSPSRSPSGSPSGSPSRSRSKRRTLGTLGTLGGKKPKTRRKKY